MSEIAPHTRPESFERCEQCQAPVDVNQRYCVSCGAHRRGVVDPAARYLSQVSPRSPARGGPSGVGAVRENRPGGLGLLGALALALIPVAAAVGIAIGRSSNNQDGKLISALERQRAQVTTTALHPAAGKTASSGSGTSTTSRSAAERAKRSKAKARAKRATASAASPKTKVSKLSGAKVTASEQAQGSSEAKKVQSSTGKNYVQADNNLPSSVVVGP